MMFRRLVINLETRPDRLREMQHQLRRIRWDAEFIQVVKPADAGPFPSVGARGCFESHLTALKQGLGSDIILMEDDLNFAPDFYFRWDEILRMLPDDWHIFYPAHDDIGTGLLSPNDHIMRSHMMMFRASIVPWLIEQLETIYSRPAGHPLGGPMHVDGAYSTIREQNPHIRTYGLSPPLGYQRPSRTDIGASRWIDQFPLIASMARRVKTRMIHR